MSVPAWFDSKAYFANKLAQVQNNEPDSNWTAESFADALLAAGIDPTNPDDLYAHFVNFGNSEGISPNGYFDPTTYVINKAALAGSTSDAVQKALDDAGLSAWDHYNSFGTAEGVNPSDNFNTDAYLQAKVDFEIQKGNNISLEQLKDVLAQNNLSALEHYYNFGLQEGVAYTPGDYPQFPDIPGDDPEPGNPGQTFYLTNPGFFYKYDNIQGTDGDDTIVGEVDTLDAQDRIDGGAGYDTMHVYTTGTSYAYNPTITNVEKIIFTAQDTTTNGGGDNITQAAYDFDRVSLADGQTLTIGSHNSRGDLTIEDVRHNSNETVISFTDADPQVDVEVYFDARHIVADGQTSSGVLDIELMDVRNNQETSGASPLLNNPFDKFTFNFTTDDGTVVPVTLDMSPYADKISGADATYDTLLEAFQSALADWEADHSAYAGNIVIAKGDTFTSSATVSGVTYTGSGSQITISSTGGTVTASEDGKDGTGWGVSSGTVPSLGGITWGVGSDAATDCPLTSTTLALSGAGRVDFDDNASCLPNLIKGSSAGDVVIGSMAGINGVERINIQMDEDSWISGLASTNEALRMVTVKGADVDGDGVVENGDLYIGDWNGRGDLDGVTYNDNMTWSDAASLLSTVDATGNTPAGAGLVDVAVFDANGYQGNINLAAAITAASYDKYLKQVDGLEGAGNPPIDGYDGFAYITGTGNDVLNMTVNGDIAADNDFRMNITTGAGDDLVAFRFADMSPNQSLDQKNLKNVTIDTGDGNDTVWFYGGDRNGDIGGSVVINTGAGNDVIYTNQQEFFTDEHFPGDPDSYNAVFVFNTSDTSINVNDLDGATLANNTAIGMSSFTVTGAPDNASVRVSVDFLGFSASVNVALSSSDTVSAKAINQAVMQAIANDPELSALISARDSAGHGLIIESKINGQYALTDLSISFSVVDASGNAASAGDLTTLRQWYATQYATDQNVGGNAYTGVNSTTSQVVVDGGEGDDFIVLGPNGTLRDVVNQSAGNDTLVGFTEHDKINLVNIFGNATLSSQAGAVTNLSNNTVTLLTGTAAAANNVFTLEEIGKQFDFAFAAGQANGAKAIAYVLDMNSSTYTVVQVVNNGNSVSTSILGTLTLGDKSAQLTTDSFISTTNPILMDSSMAGQDFTVSGGTVDGTAFDDTFTFTGSGFAYGYAGDDTFTVQTSGYVTIDGGAGTDTVTVNSNSDDHSNIAIKGVEVVDLTSGPNFNAVTINGATEGLVIKGGEAGNTLTIASGIDDVHIADLGGFTTLTLTSAGDVTINKVAADFSSVTFLNAFDAMGTITIDASNATGPVTFASSYSPGNTLDLTVGSGGASLTGNASDDAFTLTSASGSSNSIDMSSGGKDTVDISGSLGNDTIKLSTTSGDSVTITGFEAGASGGDILSFGTSFSAFASEDGATLGTLSGDSIHVQTGFDDALEASDLAGSGLVTGNTVVILTTDTDALAISGADSVTYNIYAVTAGASVGTNDTITLIGTVTTDGAAFVAENFDI